MLWSFESSHKLINLWVVIQVYLFPKIIMLQNLTMVVSLIAVQHRILTDVEYMQMMKTENMTKLMLNLMKMLMMNLMET